MYQVKGIHPHVSVYKCVVCSRLSFRVPLYSLSFRVLICFPLFPVLYCHVGG